MTECSPRPTVRDALLLVANYDSDVGYAWWLMESFWAAIARRYSPTLRVLLAYPRISKLPTEIAQAPVELSETDFSQRSWQAIRLQLQLLREARIRTMYLTDAPSISWCYLLYRLAGVRTIIVHDHTPGRRSTPTTLALFAKRLLHRVPGLAADAMIGVTPFVSRRHRDVVGFPAERCFVAENGIPDSASEERVDVRATFGIPADRRVLVSVGRAHHVKGISVVLDAMAMLIREHGRRDIHFLFCGDGPHLQDFIDQAESLRIRDHVTFAGRYSPVIPIVRGSDIAIHASTAEVGYSLSILECMQAGLPLVVSDDESVAGATEAGVTGLTFRTDDAAAAAAAIVHLLDDPVLGARLGATARERVKQHYTLARTHVQLLDAVERTMRRRDPALLPR
jgi:glycosyltransferase involved in cell wall biosynthesis